MNSPAPSSTSPSRQDLLHWQQQGRTREVNAALRRMRWRALRRGWIAFGLRLGHIVSPIMLSVLYLTLFLPFGLIGRLTARRHARWITPPRTFEASVDALRNPG